MTYAVDTNVAVVANGRRADAGDNAPSLECRLASVQFLLSIHKGGKIVVDLAGEVVAEYRNYLAPNGEPGVGDRFYQLVLNYHPDRIVVADLQKRDDGEFVDCPQLLIDGDFDPSDRKFAALAVNADARVANATDSDWIEHRQALVDSGIQVENLCGCDPVTWFEN